jgi:hypothetical protein
MLNKKKLTRQGSLTVPGEKRNLFSHKMCHRMSETNAKIETVLSLEIFQIFLFKSAQDLAIARIQRLGIVELKAAFLLHLAGNFLPSLVFGVHCEELEHQQIDRRSHHSQTKQNKRE